jgi:hypothetical protein
MNHRIYIDAIELDGMTAESEAAPVLLGRCELQSFHKSLNIR